MSKMQNCPAQRHSRMSILKIETENSLPQRHSKMSNGRLSVVLCWPYGQRAISTVQIKNTGYCFMEDGCPECYAGRMGKTSPAQRDSGDNMRGDLPPVVYNIWSAQSTKY